MINRLAANNKIGPKSQGRKIIIKLRSTWMRSLDVVRGYTRTTFNQCCATRGRG